MTPPEERGTARPRVGLALGAGGTRGAAHVGVLKVLAEAAVPIDCVAGASTGALYGAPFAAGRDAHDIERNLHLTTSRDVLRFFRHRLTIGSSNPLGERFREALSGLRFEDMAIPFAVVASDVVRREPVLIREGEVLPAVQASISLPLLAPPVRLGDRYLLDGGYWEPAPVSAARALGAEVVIAVVLGDPTILSPRRRAWARRLVALLERRAHRKGRHGKTAAPGPMACAAFLLHTMTEIRQAPIDADVVIRPRVSHLNPNSPFHMRLSFRRGEEAARKALPLIEEIVRGQTPRRRSPCSCVP